MNTIAIPSAHPCGHAVTSQRGGTLTGRKAAERLKLGCVECRRLNRASPEGQAESAARALRVAAAEAREYASWKAAQAREERAEREFALRVVEAREAMLAAGCTLEHTSDSGSTYWRTPAGLRVRISNHHVPLTDERLHNRALGGKTCCDVDIVLEGARGPISANALREMIASVFA